MLSVQFALLDGSGGHSCGKLLEIKIRNIASVSLEVRIVSEELVKLVAACLSLEKDVFAVIFECLFDLHCDSV